MMGQALDVPYPTQVKPNSRDRPTRHISHASTDLQAPTRSVETRLASATSSQDKTLPKEGPHCRPRRTFPWARPRTQVSEPRTQNSRSRSAPFGQSQFGGCRIRSPGLSSARCRRPSRSTHLVKAAPRTGLAGGARPAQAAPRAAPAA